MKSSFVLAALLLATNTLAQGYGFVECAPEQTFDARAYWTADRIRAAQALSIPVLTPAQQKRLMRRPLLGAGTIGASFPVHAFAAGGTPVGTPQPADITMLPHSLIGKLLFTKNNQDSYCTAQLVGDRSMILTAAHCIRNENTGAFNSNFSFVAGYDDGKNRLRKVTRIGGWSTFPNTQIPNYAVDYAFAKLDAPLESHLVLKTGLPATEWYSVGYPVNINAQQQHRVLGGKHYIGGNIVEMTENGMENGASGGALVTLTAPFTVIGVNSHRVGPYMASPYFDAGVADVYNYVDEGCPDDKTTPE